MTRKKPRFSKETPVHVTRLYSNVETQACEHLDMTCGQAGGHSRAVSTYAEDCVKRPYRALQYAGNVSLPRVYGVTEQQRMTIAVASFDCWCNHLPKSVIRYCPGV